MLRSPDYWEAAWHDGAVRQAQARLAGAAVVVLIGAALGAAAALPRGHSPPGGHRGGRTVAAPAGAAPAGTATASSSTAPRVAGPPPSLIAMLRSPEGWSRRPGGPVAGRLSGHNPFGQPQVLAVVGRPSPGGWVEVELPVRPNGSLGWIALHDVTLTETGYRVTVDLATRRVTVTDGTRVVLSTPAAVGTPSTPTPSGHTYLWELVRPGDPSGPYGPYIFGLAMFSDAYATFNGGDAQIGMHGQDEPGSIGRAASHGCIRLPNPVISRLAAMLPLGTPVTIR